MYNYNINPIDIRPMLSGMRYSQERADRQAAQQAQDDLYNRVLGGDQMALQELAMRNPQAAAAYQASLPRQEEMQAFDVNAVAGDATALREAVGTPFFNTLLQNTYAKYESTPLAADVMRLGEMHSQDPQEAARQLDILVGSLSEVSEQDDPTVRASKFLDSGHLMQSTDDGLRIYTPDNQLLTGDAAKEVVELNRNMFNEDQQARIDRELRKSLLVDAKEVARESFDSLKNVRSAVGNYDEAIRAIDSGASSGRIERFFPSFTEATIALENAASRLGLNVISATTFGALSAPELRLAMETAVPTNLQSKDLRKWLVRKRDAQLKLQRELREMAITLGKGKTTLAEYLEKKGYSESQEGGNQSNQSDPLGLF